MHSHSLLWNSRVYKKFEKSMVVVLATVHTPHDFEGCIQPWKRLCPWDLQT